MKKIVLFLICLFASGLFFIVSAQTQQGVVKTKGRMVNGKYVAGQGLSGATITIQGRNAVQSQTNGGFSFPIPNKTFMLQGVQKQGYQLVDPDATRKAYQYSPNTFYIVMETPDQQSEDKLAAERKIRRTLQRQLQQREDELEELKAQNKLTQEEYRKAMQQLYNDQQNNEKLIADMAKEYAEMDYDQMDELNRQISDCILNGNLTKADSLLHSKGDIHRRDVEITRRLEAEAKRKEELARQQAELAVSEDGTRKLLEDFAEDCYNYFKMYKLENKHDSATYFIELRANRDTTNVDWQFDAAYYLHTQNQNRKAQIYYERALQIFQHLAISNPEAYEMDVATTQNNLAVLYSDTQRLEEAEKMYLSALEIRQRLSASNPEACEPAVAGTQNNLASLYFKTQRLEEAEKMFLSALEIRQRLAASNPEAYEPAVAGTQNNLAVLYSDTQQLEEAEKMYLSALRTYQRLAAYNPKLYEPYVATTQYNLASLYEDTQRLEEAKKMYLSTLEIRQRLAASNPEAYEPAVAATQHNLAVLYSDTQQLEEAEKMYFSALEISQRLAASNPETYDPDVARTQNNLASLYFKTQRLEEAEKMYVSALTTYQRLVAYNPKLYEPYVATTQYNLASLYEDTQRLEEAEKMYLSALEIRQRLAASNPETYETVVAMTQNDLGGLYIIMEKYIEAISSIEKSLSIYRLVAQTNPALQQRYEDTLYSLSLLYAVVNNRIAVYQINQELLPILERKYKADPENPRVDYAKIVGSQSFYAICMKKYKESEQYAREGLQVDSTQHWIASNLAAALLFQGKYAEAEQVYRQYKEELKESFLNDFKQFAEVGVIPKEYEADVEKIKQILNK